VVVASHAWLAGTTVAFAVAFLRVPFHVYWRADAALLAQLPIEGRPLFDAALLRSVGAAVATAAATVLGIVPLAVVDGGWPLVARHAAFALTLGAAAGLLVPAMTVAAAALVVHGGENALQMAAAVMGAPARRAAETSAEHTGANGAPGRSPAAVLGALPGFASTFVIAAMLLGSPWLIGERASVSAPIVLVVIAAASLIAALVARRGAGIMGRVLRDVSALDRQRLAPLEVKPLTAIERAIAGMLGEATLAYEKDARLMRRRFPMAFALGAIAFGVLVIVGLARPDDPTPWLTIAIAGTASYGAVLATRLRRPPIELARLSATLPLSARARARAKLAWLLGWWTVFVVAPAVFAALRQTEPTVGFALAGAATIVIIVAGALPR
jgi:hypothetical protein